MKYNNNIIIIIKKYGECWPEKVKTGYRPKDANPGIFRKKEDDKITG